MAQELLNIGLASLAWARQSDFSLRVKVGKSGSLGGAFFARPGLVEGKRHWMRDNFFARSAERRAAGLGKCNGQALRCASFKREKGGLVHEAAFRESVGSEAYL
jgi:hypothetical protein